MHDSWSLPQRTVGFSLACDSRRVAAQEAEFRRVAGIILRHKGPEAGQRWAPPLPRQAQPGNFAIWPGWCPFGTRLFGWLSSVAKGNTAHFHRFSSLKSAYFTTGFLKVQ